MGFQLPSNAVRDIDFCDYNPHDLPTCDFKHGKKRNEAFYFIQTQQSSSKTEGTKRSSKDGYWKVCQEEEIYHDGEIAGFKTICVWRQEVKGTEKKGSWVMHEFRVNPSNSILPTEALDDDNIKANIKMQRCVCVLCRTKNKTTKTTAS